jgi:putative transposase
MSPAIFAEVDYRRYIKNLSDSANKFKCRVHAYVLMMNHVHLLLTPAEKQAVS